MKFYGEKDLLSALSQRDKQLAFLVGSALSIDEGGGVPGVAAMIELVQKKAAWDERFGTTLRAASEAEMYRTAMAWLHGNHGQDAVNRVVSEAVLQAHKESSPVKFEEDGQPDDWYIPKGTIDLASLVSCEADHFSGPILTTNFDPLLSLAIAKAGRRVRRVVLEADGRLPNELEEEGNVVSIVHLHGYWRGSDTLHSDWQLQNSGAELHR